jgi:hypothetical protein
MARIGVSPGGSKIGSGKLRTPAPGGLGGSPRSDNFARGKSRIRSDQGGMTSQRPAPGEGRLPSATPAQGHASPRVPLDRISPKDW